MIKTEHWRQGSRLYLAWLLKRCMVFLLPIYVVYLIFVFQPGTFHLISRVINIGRNGNNTALSAVRQFQYWIRQDQTHSNSGSEDLELFRIKKVFQDYEELFHVRNISCSNIFADVKSDKRLGIIRSIHMYYEVPLLSNEFYINRTSDCASFIKSRGYINSHLTEEERKFPIAFSMMVYKDIEMVERLLRAIYRPQNLYCIHVDEKSDTLFMKAVTAISQCFPNVFLSSRRIKVVWGTFSVLEPEIVCMKDIWSRSKKWKYFINLTGQEFPLKTNAQLVKVLKEYDGANDVSGTIERALKSRWKTTPPIKGIRLVKGEVHVCLNRKFVEYVIHNETAVKFLDWMKAMPVPDETFYSTLNHNPQLGIPGTYKGVPETSRADKRKPYLARFKNWMNGTMVYPCHGGMTRTICILSTGDLPLLGTRPELFANKFILQHDRTVIQCLEEKRFNDTRDEFLGFKSFNMSAYKNLGFVKDKIPVWTREDYEEEN